MDLWLVFASGGWSTVVKADSLMGALDKVTTMYKEYNGGVWPRMKVYKIQDAPRIQSDGS